MTFARRTFLVAAVFGFLALLPQYLLETPLGAAMPGLPLTHPEHFYGFVGVALAWQVLFVIIARDPVRLRPAMLPAALEKVAFGVPALVLFATGRTDALVALGGTVDLLLAAAFVVAHRRTPA